MIKLELPPSPPFLTAELQEKLTSKFIQDNTQRVWDIPKLKEALSAISFGKCAYSEAMLNQEGKYMQVEHFYPKSRYPEKVLEWGNLLPCINVCNSKKKDCNPAKTPIVNPLFDNPKDYFYVHNGRIFPLNPKCDKAINTIEKCDLNNDRQFRQTRYQIEMQIKAHLEIIRTAYAANPKHACNALKFLMSDSGRHSSYSATRSTYILKDKNYLYLRSVFIDRKIWENDFLPLEEELIFCSLPYTNSI